MLLIEVLRKRGSREKSHRPRPLQPDTAAINLAQNVYARFVIWNAKTIRETFPSQL